jgi:hypothetical protein
MHVDSVLTDYSRKYANGDYVAKLVCPPWPVKKLSDQYTIYDRTPQFQVNDTTMGPKSESKMVDWSVSFGTYSCLPHGLHDYVTDADVKNADAPIQPRLDTTEFLKDQLLLDFEVKVATKYGDHANYAAGNHVHVAGNDCWDSGLAAATPVADINTGIAACAVPPNTMVISYPVWMVLKEDATLQDKIKYSQLGVITEELVARLFGLEKVIVAKAQTSTAAGVLSYVWGESVWIGRVAKPGPKTIQFGVTFSPTADETVRSWREEKIGGGADAIEANWSYDYKIIAADVGYLILNAITA